MPYHFYAYMFSIRVIDIDDNLDYIKSQRVNKAMVVCSQPGRFKLIFYVLMK